MLSEVSDYIEILKCQKEVINRQAGDCIEIL